MALAPLLGKAPQLSFAAAPGTALAGERSCLRRPLGQQHGPRRQSHRRRWAPPLSPLSTALSRTWDPPARPGDGSRRGHLFTLLLQGGVGRSGSRREAGTPPDTVPSARVCRS